MQRNRRTDLYFLTVIVSNTKSLGAVIEHILRSCNTIKHLYLFYSTTAVREYINSFVLNVAILTQSLLFLVFFDWINLDVWDQDPSPRRPPFVVAVAAAAPETLAVVVAVTLAVVVAATLVVVVVVTLAPAVAIVSLVAAAALVPAVVVHRPELRFSLLSSLGPFSMIVLCSSMFSEFCATTVENTLHSVLQLYMSTVVRDLTWAAEVMSCQY